MPGKITSGVLVNDSAANLQTDHTPIVSPFSRLSRIENEAGCSTIPDDTEASLQDKVNTSESQFEFCDLISSKPSALVPHQNTFTHTTLAELLGNEFQTNLPPTSKEFKVILFNDALKNHQFGFDDHVIANIRSGLLSSSSPSYKYLASIAVSIAQTKAALAELKKEGKLNETKFNALNLQLAMYADSLSKLGNNYCRQLAKKPGEDIFTSFLVIKSHKNGSFIRLFKQAEKIDTGVKALVSSHNETKEKITRNLNNAVSQFIVHYFKPEQKENIETFQQLHKYIKPGPYDKIQALFKDESRNRPGHQFNAGGTEHLYDCYAEIFDHFKIYDQFVRDQKAANEPTTNGKPADGEMPIIPEDFDDVDGVDGVNDSPIPPNGPAINGAVEQEEPAAQRHSGDDGINNYFSPVFNPINSPSFVNNISSDLSDKLDDNNRLLAKILDQLTKKSAVSRGVQTDDMSSSVDAACSSMGLGIAERRSSAQFADVKQPKKADKSTITSTNMIDSSEHAEGITPVIVADEIDGVIAPSSAGQLSGSKVGDDINEVVAPSQATQLSRSKIAKALSHVTVLPRTAQMMNALQLNGDKQRQYNSIELMNTDIMQANLLQSRHHGQRSSVQNEMEKVVLRPTMTQPPKTFTVNSHYKDRDYYDESGKILPGFVSDRLHVFENRSDIVTFNQKNKTENKARDVADVRRDDVIDTTINRSNVTTPVDGDAVTALDNTDLPFLNQKNKIEDGARSVASALHDLIERATNQSKVITPVDDTVAEFDYADLTFIPARKVLTAERVKNHNYFLDMIRNQRQLKKL